MTNLLGKNATWESTNGAAHVNPLPGPQTLSRNRMQVDVAATDGILTVEWPANSNITYLTFIVVRNTGDTTVDAYVAFTIDAENDTEAQANIGTSGALPESLTADAQFVIVPLNVPVSVPLTTALVNGSYSGGRVDFRVIGTGNVDIFIGAN